MNIANENVCIGPEEDLTIEVIIDSIVDIFGVVPSDSEKNIDRNECIMNDISDSDSDTQVHTRLPLICEFPIFFMLATNWDGERHRYISQAYKSEGLSPNETLQ